MMSKPKLRRPIFIRKPVEITLLDGNLLLYGLSESPMHCFRTIIGMSWEWKLMLLILAFGTIATVPEELISRRTEFDLTDRIFVTKEKTSLLTSGTVCQRFWALTQTWWTSKNSNLSDRKQHTVLIAPCLIFWFMSPEWILSLTRCSKNTTEPISLIYKCLKTLNEGPSKQGLKYERLDPKNIEVLVVAVNTDKSWRIGLIAMLRDRASKTVNVIQFGSSKTKRLCHIVLAAELLTLSERFDA